MICILDVNDRNVFGQTALMLTSEYRHINTVKAMIRFCADFNLFDFKGRKAIHFALRGSEDQRLLIIIDALLGQGECVNTLTFNGYTPLLCTVAYKSSSL